ncbi:four helix bundle protein [Pirellulaceae bacterium SH501]
MNEEELKKRTKQFALRAMRWVDTLPQTSSGRTIGNQLIRSATSVGANYRATCRGRSIAQFIAKLGVVIEETDESSYWMELIIEGRLLPDARVSDLLNESEQITAIMVASRKSAIENHQSKIKNSK